MDTLYLFKDVSDLRMILIRCQYDMIFSFVNWQQNAIWIINESFSWFLWNSFSRIRSFCLFSVRAVSKFLLWILLISLIVSLPLSINQYLSLQKLGIRFNLEHYCVNWTWDCFLCSFRNEFIVSSVMPFFLYDDMAMVKIFNNLFDATFRIIKLF